MKVSIWVVCDKCCAFPGEPCMEDGKAVEPHEIRLTRWVCESSLHGVDTCECCKLNRPTETLDSDGRPIGRT